MNLTTTVIVALIVAAGGLSTMVYDIPAQRAMAVSISTTEIDGPLTFVRPGQFNSTTVLCPSGTIVTGGGGLLAPLIGNSIPFTPFNSHQPTGWFIEARNPTSQTLTMVGVAVCATIHP